MGRRPVRPAGVAAFEMASRSPRAAAIRSPPTGWDDAHFLRSGPKQARLKPPCRVEVGRGAPPGAGILSEACRPRLPAGLPASRCWGAGVTAASTRREHIRRRYRMASQGAGHAEHRHVDLLLACDALSSTNRRWHP
eukprot:scaffold638_cov382-Prasinococcus_capsulatus_cf.AAC.2